MADETTHLLSAEEDLFKSLSGTGRLTQTRIHSKSLGTIQGVFAPVCLSMLSSMLFLRMGYVVGNAGVLGTLLMFAIAYFIMVCTVLSICANCHQWSSEWWRSLLCNQPDVGSGIRRIGRHPILLCQCGQFSIVI